VPSGWKVLAQRLNVRPMSARSLVLTTLLGSHPPRLPPQALVAVGELFEVPDGTIRTALSRMAADGELVVADGRYQMSGTFSARQAALDSGRRARHEPWDGSWWAAVVLSERRPLADRRAFRTDMTRALMGELRPDVWVRPANLDLAIDDSSVFVSRGPLDLDAGRQLAGSLWDLQPLEASLRQLISEAIGAVELLAAGGSAALAQSFIVSVAVARALAAEPQLPNDLVGAGWPADELRRQYDELERLHGSVLHQFLTTHLVQD
jgi:phenylacetic acid degradation operon negative regulatory protein